MAPLEMQLPVFLNIHVVDNLITNVTMSEGSGYKVYGNPSSQLLEKIDLAIESNFLPPLKLDHLTEFQKKVYKALAAIPPGSTRTYKEIACEIGCPDGARAVGNACASNPFLYFIPCHRVLAKTGLGGFAAGIKLKKILLRFEKIKLI